MIDKEKRDRYSEVLLNAYQDGVLKIIWSTSGFSMAVDPKREEMIPEIKEEDFVEYAFSIIKMLVDLAEEKKTDEEYEGDLKTARIIFNEEQDLKTHLYIKRNSKVGCFKLLDYDIVSYRSKENPADIKATAAIMKIVTEKEDDETSCVFEISKRDLEDMIDRLIELKEKMDVIR